MRVIYLFIYFCPGIKMKRLLSVKLGHGDGSLGKPIKLTTVSKNALSLNEYSLHYPM